MECPKCNSNDIYVNFSCCKDQECCGLEDQVSCNHCDWEYETFSDDNFKEKLLELGMTEEEYIKECR